MISPTSTNAFTLIRTTGWRRMVSAVYSTRLNHIMYHTQHRTFYSTKFETTIGFKFLLSTTHLAVIVTEPDVFPTVFLYLTILDSQIPTLLVYHHALCPILRSIVLTNFSGAPPAILIDRTWHGVAPNDFLHQLAARNGNTLTPSVDIYVP